MRTISKSQYLEDLNQLVRHADVESKDLISLEFGFNEFTVRAYVVDDNGNRDGDEVRRTVYIDREQS